MTLYQAVFINLVWECIAFLVMVGVNWVAFRYFGIPIPISTSLVLTLIQRGVLFTGRIGYTVLTWELFGATNK